MLVQIGSPKEPGPSDVVDLLLECHERIRSFAGLAGRLAKADRASFDEIQDAAGRVTRYFSESLPLHVADEEQSILPRLAGRSVELDEALEVMHREHLEHEPHLRSLVEIVQSLQTSPEKLPELRQSLSSAASTLDGGFARHLEQEERTILPAIRTLLTPEEQALILSELRTRRQYI